MNPIGQRKTYSLSWNIGLNLKLNDVLILCILKKNICDNIIYTLLNIEGKSKDIDKTRLELVGTKICKELHLQPYGDKYLKPYACYTITLNDKRQSIKFLDG